MAKKGIVAFAYGMPSTIRSNTWIRDIAWSMAYRDGISVFTQRNIQFPLEWGIDVTYVEEKVGNPPPSLRIARAAIRWAALNRIDEIIIVAARPHLWRCLRDMMKAAREFGCEWIKITPAPEIYAYPGEGWFCSNLTQSRTQNEKNWRSRERILELMPFWLYKRVAK